MPPRLALVLTLAACFVFLWREARRQPHDDAALWLPVCWIFLVGAKFVSQWLQLFGLMSGGGGALEDGSPIDAAAFLALICAGVVILARRRIGIAQLARSNVWLTLFFVYCFLSIFWSDFPLVAFKRWIKVLGHPIMALVILTHRNPLDAFKRVMTRAAVVMLPLSVVFIKYYPELGRYFDPWTGEAGNGGIHNNKNELGYTCMVFGVFFIWNFAKARRLTDRRQKWEQTFISIGLLAIIWWLFSMADSATSLVCTVVGGVTIALVASPLVNRRFIGTQLIAGVLLIATLEWTAGVYETVVELLGRNPTLTDRTEIWAEVLTIDINPLIGAGFESFWLGWRREVMWDRWWWQPTQAHNGYIETYLNTGWVGVFLLCGVIITTFRKGRSALLRDADEGGLRLAFLLTILAYNYTEAAFKGVHLVWTVFHIIAIYYPTGPDLISTTLSEGVSAEDGARAQLSASGTRVRPRALNPAWIPNAPGRVLRRQC